MGMGYDNTRRMSDLIVDFPCRKQKQSASSSSKSKPKVRFSTTSRLNVISRATPEESRLMYNSSKEMANIKCRAAITVRKTWQMLNNTEVCILLLPPHIFLYIVCFISLSHWLTLSPTPTPIINTSDTPSR